MKLQTSCLAMQLNYRERFIEALYSIQLSCQILKRFRHQIIWYFRLLRIIRRDLIADAIELSLRFNAESRINFSC